MKNLWALITSFIRLPFALLLSGCRWLAVIFGMAPAANTRIAPIPDPAEDIARRLEARRPEDGFTPPAVGEAVHAYASAADGAERAHVDLSALSADQVMWLMGLGKADLDRLAQVGVKGCDRAAAGKASGVVGLRRPGQEVSRGKVSKWDPQADSRYDHVSGQRPAFAM